MNWIEAYGSEIEAVFAHAAADAARFPAPFDRMGQALLAGCNPLNGREGTNMICFLLPCWLKEETGSPEALCRDLAAGNVFAMLHYFLLDDVMDGDAGPLALEARDALALGQLCHGVFRDYYGRYFDRESPLWPYDRRYLEEWAAAVSEERRRPADPRDPVRLARKSAPIKLCAAGMLILAGRLDRLPVIAEAIELVLATLQLSDDWADWRDDLAGAQANAFLALAREGTGLAPHEPLDERRVRQAIYRERALDRLADIVRTYGERLRCLPGAPVPLLEFHEAMHQGLLRDAAAAEEMVMSLATEGGFAYYLSNQVKK
ncbi:hypothetical protein [Cohnella nanjingensis]|uniref:Uncharacterized protein n=1 Tax=Cohnella nanjingensis TaxID=1387779 RepID=A0A7X0RR06_9BACL|nr:hypothetical protein [Cohnella nanjingensis]MBB6672047.1 hypothetical protein [Cohnella nanjingensis]